VILSVAENVDTMSPKFFLLTFVILNSIEYSNNCCIIRLRSVRDAVGGVVERAAGGVGAVARLSRRIPQQDAAGGAHLAAHAATAPLARLAHATPTPTSP
jgi:hypothetical protein